MRDARPSQHQLIIHTIMHARLVPQHSPRIHSPHARARRTRLDASRAPPRASSASTDAVDVDAALARLAAYNTQPPDGPPPFCDGVSESVQADIDALIANGRVDGGVTNAVSHGVGTWRVFAMPHIARLATPLGVRFGPLTYEIRRGGKIRSDVRHRGKWVPDGWLSAAGSVKTASAGYDVDGRTREACKIVFDDFWVGRGASAEEPRSESPKVKGNAGVLDRVIDIVGRLGFIEDVATFPVLFYDEKAGIVIFQFPPLKSNICAFRDETL